MWTHRPVTIRPNRKRCWLPAGDAYLSMPSSTVRLRIAFRGDMALGDGITSALTCGGSGNGGGIGFSLPCTQIKTDEMNERKWLNERMSGWMNEREWLNERGSGLMNEWKRGGWMKENNLIQHSIKEWVDEWMNGWKNKSMNEWKWVDKWKREWLNEWMQESLS